MSWVTPGASSARVRVNVDALEHWSEEWKTDDPAATLEGDAWTFTIPYALWGQIGAPTSEDPEEVDLFAGRHSALGKLLGLRSQRIGIESVGHVGARELSFLFLVDGVRVGDAATPTPFAVDGAGKAHALLPVSFVAYSRVCSWNAKGHSTREEQIYFLAELRDHLDRSQRCLEGADVSFTFELDAHLQQFKARRVEAASLAWKPQKNPELFDLQLEHEVDGRRESLDLRKLDATSPIIAVSSTEHLLLDRDIDAVARVAKTQRNKLRKSVERHFHNPAGLIPEGVSLDKIDLSLYGPRVLGFAPIVKAERSIDIRSSGTQWYLSDGTSTAPFLTLAIVQPAGGGVETLELKTLEETSAAIERLEVALQKQPPDLVQIGGRTVEPTAALVDRLKFEVARPNASTEKPPEKPKRVAAVIAENSQPTRASESPEVPVPWSVLEPLLAPSCKLKPHQKSGLEWMWRQFKRKSPGVLVADDMGLGKTLLISAFMALSHAEPDAGDRPSLVVCPVILLENWERELKKFFQPEVFASLLVLHGNVLRNHRGKTGLDVDAIKSHRYVLTNYETLQSYQPSLLTIDWNVVVLDEAHAIKNSDTYRARGSRGLKRRFGICSTGTPVENRLSDLWGLYDFLSPENPFSTLDDFKERYESNELSGIDDVRAALKYPSADSSLLRRTKDEVLSLPPKTIEVRRVEMTAEQVDLERRVTRAAEKGGIFKVLRDLQMLYQHPRLLVDRDHRPRATTSSVLEESPKLRLCMEILRDVRKLGEKALIFTLWCDMQSLLVETIQRELGLPRIRIVNGDPSRRKNAQTYIDEFSATEGFGVLVLSPLAAGTGLTITAANHVIHYGRWWNPAKEDQATDRAYRIGQAKPVRVYYPLLTHPGTEDSGFDVKLHELVETKRGVARNFLTPHTRDGVTREDFIKVREAQR